MPDTTTKTNAKILIVDVEAVTAAGLESRLKGLGHTVCGQATNGDQILALLERHHPDLVMMDIVTYGEKNGIDTAGVINEKWGVPVIYLTTHADVDRLEKAILTYPFWYLLKPFQDRDLKAMVEMVLYVSNLDARLKMAEATLQENETAVCKKLRRASPAIQPAIISRFPEQKTRNNALKAKLEPPSDLRGLELDEIIDVPSVQSLMEQFHRITGMLGAIVDNKGKVIVSVGWQDICTKFHRCHHETLQNCVESDTVLAHGAESGTFKSYHCKNGMWDMASPIEVSGKHMGNIYFGQFFYTDEEADVERFRDQARRYGFDETEYLTALDRVPHYDREMVREVMTFYSMLGEMISSLSFSNLSLSRTLSERKQAEEALRESEEKFRGFSEQSIVGIYLIKNGVFTYVNPKFAEIFGYTVQECMGNMPFSRLVHQDDLSLVSEEMRKRVSGEKAASQYQIRGLTKDRRIIYIDIYGTTIRNGDEPAFMGVVLNITDRKKAEEALRESEALLSVAGRTAQFGGWSADPEGRKVVWSEQVALIHGKEPGYSPSLEEVIQYYAPEWREKIASVFGACARQGRPYDEELEIMIAGDRRLWVRTTGEAIRDSGGKIIRVQGSFQNITDRKREEKERELLKAQLQQAQKMEAVGTLAGGISHDFNNLLQVINGYTQLLLMEKFDSDRIHNSLKAIQDAGFRAAELVGQLLLFSRKVDSIMKPLELKHEVEQAKKMLERIIPKMIQIQVTSGTNIWSINGDPVQIEQMLLNFGTNAADAMPEGGKLVFEIQNTILDGDYATLYLDAQPGQYVVLTISDTGHGMDKETQEKIFEPFFTTKEVGKGTGLGLASVYGTVKSHGGYIVCNSELGQGTTFKIYLPAMVSPEIKSREVKSQTMHRGNEKILIVDDEVAIRSFAKEALMRFGYQVFTASTGEEALEFYENRMEEIDLLITDVGMPGISGHKLLQELLQINPAVNVIIASGYAMGRKAIEAGAKGYVGKPYQLVDLLNMVRAVLDGKT